MTFQIKYVPACMHIRIRQTDKEQELEHPDELPPTKQPTGAMCNNGFTLF